MFEYIPDPLVDTGWPRMLNRQFCVDGGARQTTVNRNFQKTNVSRGQSQNPRSVFNKPALGGAVCDAVLSFAVESGVACGLGLVGAAVSDV